MKRLLSSKRGSSYQQVSALSAAVSVAGDNETADVSDDVEAIELKCESEGNSAQSAESGMWAPQSDMVSRRMFLWSKVASPCFVVIAIVSAIGLVLGILQITALVDFIWFLLAVNFIGSTLAAFGSYKWGKVQAQISALRKLQTIHESLVQTLQTQRERIEEETEDKRDNLDDLRRIQVDLAKSVRQMEGVYSSLLQSADGNADILSMAEEINAVANELQRYALVNKRASLLSAYYGVCFADGRKGLSRNEYRRFLAHLPETDKRSFQRIGSFDHFAANDCIDIAQFTQMVERVVDQFQTQMSFLQDS